MTMLTRQRLQELVATTGFTHVEARSRKFKADGSKWPVICLHGSGSNSIQFIAPGYVDHVTEAIAETGRLVMSIDAGGIYNWGGPACQTEIPLAITKAVALGAKSGGCILLGLSMGCIGALKFLKDNPSTVKATALLIPAVDLSAHHDTPTGGSDVANIEAAYTDLAGYTAAVGAYDPTASPASFTGKPIKAWYATDDTRAPTSWLTSFRTAVGGSAFALQSLGAVGHNPIPTDADQVVDFIEANVTGG